MRSGDDAGWVAAGWKRPSSFFDMPIEIGALGRGSPTGVVVGSATSYPTTYEDAIFVADWTFGRVVAFRRNLGSGGYDRGTNFAVADGQFGFAVTDLDFARDGSLLISAGGRGTQGAIYRVSFVGQRENDSGSKQQVPEFFTRVKSDRLTAEVLVDALNHSNRTIQVAALEGLVGRRDILQTNSSPDSAVGKRLVSGLQSLLQTAEPKTLELLARVARDLDPLVLHSVDDSQMPVVQLMIESLIPTGTNQPTVDTVSKIADELASGQSDSMLVARIGQLALGGCGAENSDQMFMGYTSRSPVKIPSKNQKTIADQLAVAIAQARKDQSGSDIGEQGLQEIGRFAAMLGCGSSDLQAEMADLISRTKSTAQQDIHWLNCLSQIIDDRNNRLDERLELRVAMALVGVSEKIRRDQQNIDRNFAPRMMSLTRRLCQRAGLEFSLMVATNLSGSDDQVFLFDSLTGMARDAAVPQFAATVESDHDRVTARQLNAIASHSGGIYLPLVRKFSGRKDLQDVVVASLVTSPIAEDRELFVRGLRSSNLKTVKNSAIGLRRLDVTSTSDEIVGTYAALRRLVWDKPSVSVRDQLILLLQHQTGREFGYQRSNSGLVQADVVERWNDFVESSFPREFVAEFEKKESRELDQRLAEINWTTGDAARGKQVYTDLQCAQCHDSGSRLGPRLTGIAKRFGREDIFHAIVLPNEQVPERYRAVVIETVDGQFFRGSMIYESVDGITLQESDGNTVRINQNAIESRSVSKNSLMPVGLLKEATDQDWSDLFAYLNQ